MEEKMTNLFEEQYQKMEETTKNHINLLYKQYREYDRIQKFCLDIEAEWNEYASATIGTKKRSYVYFIKNTVNNLIKIGCTRDIRSRYSAIKSTCLTYFGLKDCIQIMGAIDTSFINCEEVEKYFHKKYNQYRSFGEWFNLPENEIEMLKEDFIFGDYEYDDMINYDEVESIGLKGYVHNITYVGNPKDKSFMDFLYSRYDTMNSPSDDEIKLLAKVITERISGIKLYPIIKTINNMSFYRYILLKYSPLFVDLKYDLYGEAGKARLKK